MNKKMFLKITNNVIFIFLITYFNKNTNCYVERVDRYL